MISLADFSYGLHGSTLVHVLDTFMAAVNNIRDPWDASPFADVIGAAFGFTFLLSVVSLYLLSRGDTRRYYGVQ